MTGSWVLKIWRNATCLCCIWLTGYIDYISVATLFWWQPPQTALKESRTWADDCSCTRPIYVVLTKECVLILDCMLLLFKQQQYRIYKTDHRRLQGSPQGFCLRMLHKTRGRNTWSLADVDIPVPITSLVPPLGYHFPFLATVAILRFMPASLFVALVVILLSTHVPRAVARLSVSVATAAVGLISMVMFSVWGIVVYVVM